jgi:hypothetical protein
MNRLYAWILVAFCLTFLTAPAHCSAQYYGQDAARTLTERLENVRDYPVGHPRVYDLQGYHAYRQYSRTHLDSQSRREATRQRPKTEASGSKQNQTTIRVTRSARDRPGVSRGQQLAQADHQEGRCETELAAVLASPSANKSRSIQARPAKTKREGSARELFAAQGHGSKVKR